MGEKTFWEAVIFLGVRINELIKSKIEEKSHTLSFTPLKWSWKNVDLY